MSENLSSFKKDNLFDQRRPSAPEDTYRLVQTKFNENLNPYSSSSLSHENCKIRALALWPSRTIVPVIFIPGIMGTNLLNTQTGADAWIVPNGLEEGIEEAIARRKQSPASRQLQLDPQTCTVKERNDAIHLRKFSHLNADEAIRRHWGELHAESYLPILESLEENLNYPYDSGSIIASKNGLGKVTLNDLWQKVIDSQATVKNTVQPAWSPKSPLTEEELKSRIGRFYFPVYACGYVWLDSNLNSARRVVARIDEIDARIKKHMAQAKAYFNVYPGKFILVTHSMGGLVARAAVQLPELQDKILGVVHGVQPVTGAPVVYRRFKAGTEHGGSAANNLMETATAYVLGYGADNVTCVMANAPGPLELLPTQYFGPGWLQFTDGRSTFSLPTLNDPYEEIYKIPNTKKWWGMVDPSLIDPANKLDKTVTHSDPHEKIFLPAIERAIAFHKKINLTCHPNTYAYYGDDQDQRSFPKVIWRSNQSFETFTESDILNAHLLKSDLQGTTEVLTPCRRKITFTLDYKPDGIQAAGDGTVPTTSSSAAARLEGIKDTFRLKGFDHQFSYANEVAQLTVFYSIAKIIQSLPVLEAYPCKF